MLTLYYLLKKSKKNNTFDVDQYYTDSQENISLNIKDLSSKCRVCLQEGSVSICGDDNADILEALHIVADIQVNENEEYPKCLCAICYKFIKGVIVFKKVAKRSEEILKQPVKEELRPLEEESIFEQHDNDFSDSSLNETKHSKTWTNEEVSNVKTEKKKKCAPKVTCNVCNKLINRSYYKEHVTMHDPNHQKYVCDICGKSFRLRCAYHNHSLRHRTDFPHKCQFCPYRGRYAELLKTHMKTHTGDYRYMCTECPARFLFKSNLNSHMLKHKEPEFKCDGCKRAFHTKLMLQKHFEADHLGIKNHVCNLCGKAFGYRNAMMKHQRQVHKREKLLFGRMPAYLRAECSREDM